MESLLSLAFDNIASRNTNKTSKGLRQIEGLLVQICLSPSTCGQPSGPQPLSATVNHAPPASSHQLHILAEDLAFQEFFRLQESFEWNLATRLTECLERLLGMRSSPQTDDLIHSTLSLLQGSLLLHPPSRTLFARENHMNLVLDLLDPTHTRPQTLCAALQVLTTALLDHPTNARLFEALDGVSTVASLWKQQLQHNQQQAPPEDPAAQDVEAQCREFVAFYLMPETPPAPSTSAAAAAAATAAAAAGDMPPPPPPAPSAVPPPPAQSRTPSARSSGSSASASPATSTVNSTGSGVSLPASVTSASSAGSGGDRAVSTRSAAHKRRLLNAYLDKGTAAALGGQLGISVL